MKKFFSFLSILILSISLYAQKNDTPRFALVIGNQTYDESPLKNPIADAKSMKNALENCGFDVTFATDLDSTKLSETIASYASKVSEVGKNSISFFYYSGHGVQINGKNYMVPLNDKGITDEIKAEGICYEIDRVFRLVKSSTQIVVLDACRNNPFSSSKAKFQKGLTRISNPSGVTNFMAFFSTSDGATADDGKGKNSLFTEKLSKHILNDFNTPVSTVFNNVANDVKNETNGKQVPLVTGTGVNFELMNSAVAEARINALKTSIATDKKSKTSSKNFNSVSSLAQAEIEMLEKRKIEADKHAKLKAEEQKKNESIQKKNKKEMERMQKEAAAKKKAYQNQKAKEKSSLTFIGEIEDNKEALQNIRLAAADKIYNANLLTQQKADSRIDDINNAPLRATEKDANGNINSATKKKRKAQVKAVENEKNAERQKNFSTFYEKIQAEETERLNTLAADEKTLSSAVYTASSLIDEVSFTVSSYDGSKYVWYVKFKSKLMNRDDLFESKIELPYKSLCELVLNQKYVDPNKASDEQYNAYSDAIETYDMSLHSSNPPILIEVDYKISPDSESSSYNISTVASRVKYLQDENIVLNEKRFSQSETFTWKKQTELKTVEDIVKAYEKRDLNEKKERERAARLESGNATFMDKINAKVKALKN